MTTMIASPAERVESLVHARLAELLAGLDRTMSSDGLYVVSTVAETLLLAPEAPALSRIRRSLVDVAGRWARNGVLADLVFCDCKHVNAFAALAYLAGDSGGDSDWTATIAGLIASGHAFRSELPAVSRCAAAAFLRRSGSTRANPGQHLRDCGVLPGRRLLRARDDESDVVSLTRLGQLRRLGEIGRDAAVVHYCEGIIATALRRGDDAWVAVAAVVARLFGTLAPALERVVRERVAARLERPDCMHESTAAAFRAAIASLILMEEVFE